MNYSKEGFVGVWKTDQRPVTAEPQDGDVVIDFDPGGTAKYSIYYPNQKQTIVLTYRIDSDHIITEQPPKGSPLRTKFASNPDGSLLLWFNNVKGRFLRVDQKTSTIKPAL